MNIKKVLKNTGFILPIAVSLGVLQADALQVVYPKNSNHQTYAKSTFFVGNTAPESVLKINGKNVKVYENGAFVEFVELKDGVNKFEIESKIGSECEKTTYTVKKLQKNTAQIAKNNEELTEFAENEYMYVAAVKNNVPLRENPNNNAKRITHVSKDTVLMVNGKKGGYFRVSLTPEKNVWILADSVVNYSPINTKMLAVINKVDVSEDKFFTYIKTEMSFPVPYVITETDCGLNLDLFNIKEHPADTKFFKPTETIKSFAINNVQNDNLSTYFVELNDKLWGYDAFYEGNKLVLKIRKTPQIDVKNPLKNITIAIDAGHGGNDAGAIGPTCVKEKDVNLEIAKKLKNVLENAGANVIMTREDDCAIGLYERIDAVRSTDALILLSIHANALPDGANPYVKHGTSVFYYNNESKELAQTLKSALVENLALRDDGTCFGNFVLTRATMPLSVLLEIAYMINPEDYKNLLDENFRQKAAESIKTGLENYLLNSLKKNLNNTVDNNISQ